MVFLGSLSDNKSPQVSRTLLSVLAVFNNAVVWMVSTRPPTFKPSSRFIIIVVVVVIGPFATQGWILSNPILIESQVLSLVSGRREIRSRLDIQLTSKPS